MEKFSRLCGGILLISGTTIGAAMLALPVVTGLAGFYPAVLLFVFFWLFMSLTALQLLEVNLWMDNQHNNLLTMAKTTLGKSAAGICWIVYLFLLYALTTAYIAGSGTIFLDFIHATTSLVLPGWLGSFPLLLIFGWCVYRGARSVDMINRLMMIGLILSYIGIIIYLTPHVQHEKLEHVDWFAMWTAVPIVATSFGYHIIIPTLTHYMKRDISLLKWAIYIGSLMPLVAYIDWEYLALGILPIVGPNGIMEGYAEGVNGAHMIGLSLNNPLISTLTMGFSFFAIVTSFLGVSLSLSDFLADGFKVEKNRQGRFLLFVMTFVPPIVIAIIDPRAFLSALEYAGVFGVILLLGLFPPLMTWAGRYRHHYYSAYKAPGGMFTLILTMIVSVAIILMEIISKITVLIS